MRAAVHDRYGPPEVLEIRDIEKPALTGDSVLVRVRAAGINAMDWYFLTGIPYAVRHMLGVTHPKRRVPGVDFAGTVEAVGTQVRHLKPGDEVFGVAKGSFAEYAITTEDKVLPLVFRTVANNTW